MLQGERFGQRGHIERVTHLSGHRWQLGIIAILGIQILLMLGIKECPVPTIVQLVASNACAMTHRNITIDRNSSGNMPPLQGKISTPVYAALNPDDPIRGRNGDIAASKYITCNR